MESGVKRGGKNSPSTISLIMVVSEESENLARTLRSVKSYISYWYIALPSGAKKLSNEIAEFISPIDGKFLFGLGSNEVESKNFLLAKARQEERTDFILIINEDEELCINGGGIEVTSSEKCYLVPFESLDESFYQPRLLATSLGWRYDGIVHPTLNLHLPYESLPTLENASVLTHRRTSLSAKSRLECEQMIDFLQETPEEEERLFRQKFFLGTYYFLIEDFKKAKNYLEESINYLDDHFETPFLHWYCRFQLKKIGEKTDQNRWSDILDEYLKLYEEHPEWPFVLDQIAKHYRDRNEPELEFIFIRYAAKLRPLSVRFWPKNSWELIYQDYLSCASKLGKSTDLLPEKLPNQDYGDEK